MQWKHAQSSWLRRLWEIGRQDAAGAVESSQTNRWPKWRTYKYVRHFGHLAISQTRHTSTQVFLKFLTRLVVSKSIDLINEKIDSTRSTWSTSPSFFDRLDLADFRLTQSINYGVYYLVAVCSVLNIKYMVWIIHCCIPTTTTDSTISIGMIRRVPQRSAANCQGISHCLESGHPVYPV